MDSKPDLAKKHCQPCSGKTPPLSESEIQKNLQKLSGWVYVQGLISKEYQFKNFDETMAFVNAVAGIARQEDHHPDVNFGYRNCRVAFKTHAINALSENDFIAAAKIDQLLAG